jgi:membrane protease YdiL (CAAX protease family)
MKHMAEQDAASQYPVDTEADATPQPEAPASAPVKRRKFFDRKILAPTLMFILFILISNIGYVGISILKQEYGLGSWAESLLITLLALVFLLWYQFHFRDEFDGLLSWSTAGLILAAPALTFVAVNLLSFFEATTINPLLPTLIMALAPGVSEEVFFRGIPGSNWIRVSGKEKDILPNVFFTAVIFGIVHSLNALSGAAISSTIFQVVYAFSLGVFFCAIMLRTGSLWPTMIAHTLIDFTGFLFMDMSHSGIITDELSFDLTFFLSVAASIIVLACGLYLVRPAKRAEIVALWDKKWHRAA